MSCRLFLGRFVRKQEVLSQWMRISLLHASFKNSSKFFSFKQILAYDFVNVGEDKGEQVGSEKCSSMCFVFYGLRFFFFCSTVCRQSLKRRNWCSRRDRLEIELTMLESLIARRLEISDTTSITKISTRFSYVDNIINHGLPALRTHIYLALLETIVQNVSQFIFYYCFWLTVSTGKR